MSLVSRIFVIIYCFLTLSGLTSCNKSKIESFPCENVTFYSIDFCNLFVNETGYYLLFSLDIDKSIPSKFQSLVILKSTDYGHKWEKKMVIDSLYLNPHSSCADYNNKIYFFGAMNRYNSKKISVCSYDYEQNTFACSSPYLDSYGGFLCSIDSLYCYDWSSLYCLDKKLNAQLVTNGISKYRPFSTIDGRILMRSKYKEKFSELFTDSLIQSPVTIDAIQRIGESLIIIGRTEKDGDLRKVMYDLKKKSFSEISKLDGYKIISQQIKNNGDSLLLTFLSKNVHGNADLYYTKNNGKDWKFIYGIDIDYFHNPYCLYNDTLFYVKESNFSNLITMNKVILE